MQLRLSEMRLCRPRQWGACWLAGQLWGGTPRLDRFWSERLPVNRKGTRWDQILQVLNEWLIAPGSEWKLHRDWFGRSAMADLLGSIFAWPNHTSVSTPVMIFCWRTKRICSRTWWHAGETCSTLSSMCCSYDLTSTYFEINAADVPEGDKRRHGYSRDKRPDCPQMVIALVVTLPDGLKLLAYEVLPGNTADCKTLRTFLDKIAQQYGRARRVGHGPRHS